MWNLSYPSFVNRVDLPRPFELTDFTPQALSSFGKSLHKSYSLEIPIFPILISSYGGDITCLDGFISLIQNYREKGIEFCTIVPGFAMSAGAFIFLMGSEGRRFMGSSATLMIHNYQVSHPPDRLSAMAGFSEFSQKQNLKLNQMLSKHLKKNKDWLTKLIDSNKNDDVYLTAQEAQELKLCSIGNPQINMILRSEFSITL